MPLPSLRKTFTLIEMLIVIVIIGILAAALVPRLQAIQGRARDSKRKVDLKSIYNANEIYRLDNNRYANATTCQAGGGCNSTGTQPWISDLSGLMTTIPIDPINNSLAIWTTGSYAYWYRGYLTGNNNLANYPTYDLATQLENTRDPDRCETKLYKWSTNTGFIAERCNPAAGAYRWIYEYSPDSNSF